MHDRLKCIARFAATAAESGGQAFAESLQKKIDKEVGAFRAKLSDLSAGKQANHHIAAVKGSLPIELCWHSLPRLAHWEYIPPAVVPQKLSGHIHWHDVMPKPWLAEAAAAASPAEGKPSEHPTENGDPPSASASPVLEGAAAEAAAQAEAAAFKRRVFRGSAPPALLLQDLRRCEYSVESQTKPDCHCQPLQVLSASILAGRLRHVCFV